MATETHLNRSNSALKPFAPAFLEDFAGHEEFLPHVTAGRFPHILEKLNLLWPGKECNTYLDSLLVSDRVSRAGFSPDVGSELMLLKDVRDHLYPDSHEAGSSWDHGAGMAFEDTSMGALLDRFEKSLGDRSAWSLGKLAASKSLQLGTRWGEYTSAESIVEALSAPRTLQKLGEVFVAHGVLSAETVADALRLQTQPGFRGSKIGRVLVDIEAVRPIEVRRALVIQRGGVAVDVESMRISQDILKLVPLPLARKAHGVPLVKLGNSLVVAFESPLSMRAFQTMALIQKSTGLNVRGALASGDAIERRLANYKEI